ncbi:serine/threonine-protein kinase RIO3 [Battus philenor]|uniref:serine/threonine-protein kinase RIO3 n=1 Tax=Battus philenor TaxID=42288 RepID=UPI0035D04257
MSNPWKKVQEPVDVQNLSDIMSEEYAKGLQVKEEIKFAEQVSDQHILTESDDLSPEILQQIAECNVKNFCDSDAIIAKVLQCQFDKEYDDEVKRVEKKRNGDAKVSISYDNYRNIPEHLVYDSDSDDDAEQADKKDWDRFETNEKEYASLPKRGFIMKDGEMVTKHDSVINGRRNACRIMAFPPEVCTGDGAGFDMKLPNSVFNQLKEHTKCNQKKHKLLDRKESQATAVMGLDEPTRLILFKMINNGMLEDVNGVISTGKESVVLHATGDQSFPEFVVPKECAIKVFKTTLNEFKTRDKYIEADYRFKDRFSKQNPRKIVHMWAEKEMHNMMRMQKIGLNCPDKVCLKKHILVMSFIGRDNKPAPKLRDVILNPDKWESVYNEIVEAMHKMYNIGHLVHADLSEYNILWWENKCWFIDVSQSVQPDHPSGLTFLLRDCRNIINFFEKKGVPNIKTADELFKSITGFEEVDVNFLEGVHTVYNSLSSRFEIAPDDNRNVSYPFEYCWQKTNENKQTKEEVVDSDKDEFEDMWAHSIQYKTVDDAANFGNEVKLQNTTAETTKVVDEVAFGNIIGVAIPKNDDSSGLIDKKS